MSGLQYRLVSEIHASEGAIRSLAGGEGNIVVGSASNAPMAKRFRITASTLNALPDFVEVGTEILHDHWVTAVTTLAPSVNETYPDGAFITGCYDSNIRVYHSKTQELLLKIEGHTKGVISLSWTSNNKLVSGSWDGTARIWDLELGGACLMELGGHENAVKVLGLGNGALLSVSSGESVDSKPANMQLRVWDPSTGEQKGKSIVHHSGPIRDVQAVPGLPNGFATCSNDGSIRVYSVDESGAMSVASSSSSSSSSTGMTSTDALPGAIMHHPLSDNPDAPNFVLALCGIPVGAHGGGCVVSCDVEGGVLVWDHLTGAMMQTLPHPDTVWCAIPIPGGEGDFVTGCEDGVVRLFSKNPSFTSQAAARQLHADFGALVDAKKAASRNGPSASEVASYVKWEDRLKAAQGKSEGHVQVFNKAGTAIAAQLTSGSWVELGEVTGSSGSRDAGEVNGVAYDHVLPVEMEGAGGFVHTYKLGWNDTENPYNAAQRFLDQNELSQSFLREVADWIMQRSGNSGGPTIGSGAGAAVGGNSSNGNQGAAPSALVGDVSRPLPPSGGNPGGSVNPPGIGPPSSRGGFSQPLSGYLGHGELPPIEKLMQKLHDLNEGDQTSEGTRLSTGEMQQIRSLVETLHATSTYHVSVISQAQAAAAMKIVMHWEDEATFPGWDLLRMLCTHPSGATSLAGLGAVPEAVSKAQAMLAGTWAGGKPLKDAVKLTVLKFLNNAFRSTEMRRALLGVGVGSDDLPNAGASLELLVDAGVALLDPSAMKPSKAARAAMAALAANLVSCCLSTNELRSRLFNTSLLHKLAHLVVSLLSIGGPDDSSGATADSLALVASCLGTLITAPEIGPDLLVKIKAGESGDSSSPGAGLDLSTTMAIVQSTWADKMTPRCQTAVEELARLVA